MPGQKMALLRLTSEQPRSTKHPSAAALLFVRIAHSTSKEAPNGR